MEGTKRLFEKHSQSGLSSTNSSDDEEEAKRPSKLKASSPSYQDDSKWDIKKTFLQYRIVTETAEQGICLAKTLVECPDRIDHHGASNAIICSTKQARISNTGKM